MSKSPKTVFACQECGAQSPKWLGRCADCGAWNSLVEERAAPADGAGGAGGSASLRDSPARPAPRSCTRTSNSAHHARLTTGIDEFDRVLGGGVVPGSLVLLGGEPGIGKSTLLLQAAANMARTRRAGALQLGRGVRAPDQVARRAPCRRQRAALPAGRDLPRAHPRRDRPRSSRRSSSSTRCRRSSR